MRNALILGLGALAILSAPARAQSSAALAMRTDLERMRSSQYDPGDARGFSRSSFDRDSSPRTECLIRKSDHQRVCHNRAIWREIALRTEQKEKR
jgi:hypothetical protein